MKHLFDATELHGLKLKNRLWRSATWEALAGPSGHFDERIFGIYDALAAGGVGAIVSGFTSVSDEDVFFGQARLSNDSLIAEHRRLAKGVHAHGTPFVAQLALNEGPRNPGDALPLFATAAGRAALAGYDGVQIHAAHGFYLSRVVASYGNPGAFLRRLADAMREAAPALHLSMKMDCDDLPMQIGLEVFTEVAAHLDSIEVSGNGTSVPGIRTGRDEGYFAPFAAALAERTKTPVILVGGHRSVECMERLLNSTKISCLSLSRPLIREPDLPNRWLGGDTTPAKCVSCNSCYRTPAHECIFNLHARGW